MAQPAKSPSRSVQASARIGRVAHQSSGQIDDELADLVNLPTEELKRRWQALFGRAAPRRISRILLLRVLAHHRQLQHAGGLKLKLQRVFERHAAAVAAGALPVPASAIKPGTRLLRQWQGALHEVIVLEEGVRYQDRVWRSLSEVAGHITGSHRSGPLFFGLRRRASHVG